MTIKQFLLLVGVCASTQLSADTKMFVNQNPTNEQMEKILFPKNVKKLDATRTISSSSSAKKLGIPIKFDLNSFTIHSDSKEFLDKLGYFLSLKDSGESRLVIEGHTDSVGTKYHNKVLSKKRAASVKEYLTSNFKIKPSLIVKGSGESQPLPNLSPDDKGNRRVEFYAP